MAVFRQISAMLGAAPRRAPDRGFMTGQLLGGAAGFAALLAYALFVTMPGWAETIAFLWLTAHAGFAFLAADPERDAAAKAGATASLTLLIAYLCSLTGGLTSPFLPWLLVLPADGALTRQPRMILWSAGATAFGIMTLALIAPTGLTAAPLLPAADTALVRTLVALAAGAYAGAAIWSVTRAERNAQAAARRGALVFQAVTEGAGDLILRMTPAGELRFVSAAGAGLLGFDPAALVGRSVFDFVAPGDRAVLSETLLDAAHLKRPTSAEVRMMRGGGGLAWMEFRCDPVNDGAWGREVDIVAVGRDTSVRRAFEDQLARSRDLAERANSSKSSFLANMSHELRTPLNAIIGFSDVMRQEMFGAVTVPKYKEYAGLIHDSGRHLLDLIGDVLDMSKIEAGKFELTPEPVDAGELIAKCLETVKVTAEKKKVTLTANLAAAPGLVADRRALKQILLNLLSNAIKFTPAGGTVEIATATKAGWFWLGVADDGVGIGEEDLKRLGKPFEQAAGAYTREHEGTGLGLSLVRSFVEMHGGRLEIESALGEGTTVRAFLPMTPQSRFAEAAE
ncbi:MAG: PAS domain-containing sensor histidine kinase [Micropepsaceae bacterium]